MLKHDFCFSETEETRYKRVNSLKACKLQSQLTMSELGASCTTFQNVLTRHVVLQCRYGPSFAMLS